MNTIDDPYSAWLARIARASPEARARMIREALAPDVDLRQPDATAVLHRRALFVTQLREQKLWP